MTSFSRHATIDWQGTIMEGGGDLHAGTGAFKTHVTFPRRIGEPHGSTSPEELIAAAHATCFAMVMAGALGKANASTKSSHVTCTITATKGDAGIKIAQSKLVFTAEGLTGMDAATLDRVAKEAEGRCPVSNALRGQLEIEVETHVK